MEQGNVAEYILTIGIPTYNRSRYFEKCLEAICRQLTDKMPVEVLVSDNYSTDSTEMVAKSYREKYPQLKYVRQEENIGGSNNFRYIWRSARGRFVLLIGDDDYLAPGAIGYILKAIQVDMDVALLHMKIDHREQRIYVGLRGRAQYVQHASYLSTYISTLVLRREYIDIDRVQASVDSLGLSDTALFQVALEMDVLGKDRKFTVASAGWFLPGTGESVHITPKQYMEIGTKKGLPDLGAVFIGEYLDILSAYLGEEKEKEKILSDEKKRLLYEFLLQWTELSARKQVRWGAMGVMDYYCRYYANEPYFEEGRARLAPIVARLETSVKTDSTDMGEQFTLLKEDNRPMKVVLLAGGMGTRISEESEYRPKPMVEIGGMPILWHIMKEYSHYGFREFIICAGYKQHMIKEWFADYFLHTSDVTFDFTQGSKVIIHDQHTEPWKVTVVDTGLETMTGGRLRRVQKYLEHEPFLLTYGDGVCDVNIGDLVRFHREHGRIATLTAVRQKQQKGVLDISIEGAVRAFREKQEGDGTPINAGYMVLEPEIFGYLDGDMCILEQAPLSRLAAEGQLMSYQHEGFWQCMDTLREKQILERLWRDGNAPWKVW